eukprot:11785131-Prorocentrum_lima.AAC.1
MDDYKLRHPGISTADNMEKANTQNNKRYIKPDSRAKCQTTSLLILRIILRLTKTEAKKRIHHAG